MSFFSYTLPKFIARNEIDEHKYLLPVLAFVCFSLYSIAMQMGAGSLLSCMLVTIPVAYYCYLINLFMNVEFDFDLTTLNLSKDAADFMQQVASTYNDEVRFLACNFTAETLAEYSPEEKIEIFKEIDRVLKAQPELSVKFYMYSYGTDESKMNRPLIQGFLNIVEVYLTPESLCKFMT